MYTVAAVLIKHSILQLEDLYPHVRPYMFECRQPPKVITQGDLDANYIFESLHHILLQLSLPEEDMEKEYAAFEAKMKRDAESLKSNPLAVSLFGPLQ